MARFIGTLATDYLLGTDNGDTIAGLGGDDVLKGLVGGDKIKGGSGDDELFGGDGADNLTGGSGYDLLVGGKGNDVLDGGSTLDSNSPAWWTEVDTVGYLEDGGSLAVNVNLSTGKATDTFGNTDTLIDIERVSGSMLADSLVGGNAANDSFEAFIGFGGGDFIDGGTGWDVAEYYWDREQGGYNGVIVDILAGTIRDGFGTIDTVVNVEEVRGTSFSDLYTGAGGDDVFMPFAGNDQIDGGAGYDSVSYAIDIWCGGRVGIRANLSVGLILDTSGYVDSVVSIEGIGGSFWDDRIIGDDAGNGLYGNEGSDVIKGRTGDDGLLGGQGNDLLFGGEGADYLEGWSGTDTMRGGNGGDTFGIYRESDTDIILEDRRE